MQRSSAHDMVPFWYTKLGEEEIAAVSAAIRAEHLSQGPNTKALERALADFLSVPHVVLTTSGSVALLLALASLGIGPGDEVIVPNRTFIATAHAALMLGARVRLVDSRPNSPIIDERQIERAITGRTKAILPVHLNGRAADMRAICAIAKAHGIFVVEDAAQAFASKTEDRYLGTQGDLGCWSLGVTKLVTTGQGGFVCTGDARIHDRLVRLRSHGVLDTFDSRYDAFGLNFRYNDLLAAIGLVQLAKVPSKVRRHVEVYRWYDQVIKDVPYLRMIPVDIEVGEVPLWVEVLCSERRLVIEELAARGIQARPFLPDLSASAHLGNNDGEFRHSKRFAEQGLFLPVGPDLPQACLERTAHALLELNSKIKPFPDAVLA